MNKVDINEIRQLGENVPVISSLSNVEITQCDSEN